MALPRHVRETGALTRGDGNRWCVFGARTGAPALRSPVALWRMALREPSGELWSCKIRESEFISCSFPGGERNIGNGGCRDSCTDRAAASCAGRGFLSFSIMEELQGLRSLNTFESDQWEFTQLDQTMLPQKALG